MTSKTLYVAMVVLVIVCAGCHEPAYAPTKQSQPATDQLNETAADSPTERGAAATPQVDRSQAEQDAQRGLDVNVNLGNGGVGVDVGDNGVNVDVGKGKVGVDVGDAENRKSDGE